MFDENNEVKILTEDVTKEDLAQLSPGDFFEPEFIASLYDIEDLAERARIRALLMVQAQRVGCVRELKDVLKAYDDEDARLGREYQDGLNNFTDFTFEPDIHWACGPWVANDRGVSIQKKGGAIQVASSIPIVPIALMRNISTGKEKVKLSFFKHGRQTLTVERKTVANASRIVDLSSDGVEVTTDNAKLLVKYIADCVAFNLDDMPYLKAFSQLGWNETGFTPYSTDAVFDGEEENRTLFGAIKRCGDFAAWKEAAKVWRRNKAVRLMMDASFASVLIEKTNSLPFVFHLWGKTGTGKTVALKAAMSIWGNPSMGKMVRTMNMTQNAMLSTAAFLNSIPFAGDELQTIKSRYDSYDQLIMRVTEGIDRGRMSYDKVNETRSWRCAFLFTGEDPCTQSASGGGVKNRVIELEVTDKLFDDGNTTTAICEANYGHAGKEFVENVMKREDLQPRFKALFSSILDKTDTTDKQAASMALILLADQIAAELFFPEDAPLTVPDVAEYLFSEKDVDVAERAYNFIIDHIAANENRFNADNLGEIWGRQVTDRGKPYTMIIKTILERELRAAGFDFDAIKSEWAKKGYIVKFGDRFTNHTKVFGINSRFAKIAMPESPVFKEQIDEEDEDVPF